MNTTGEFQIYFANNIINEFIKKLELNKDYDDEKRIALVIECGKKIVDIAIKIFDPCLIAAGFSGGNDSVVSTHFICEEYKNENPEVFYANTEIGLKSTRNYIHSTCSRFNWDLQEYKAEPEGRPKFHYDKNERVPYEEYYKLYGIESKLPRGKENGWIEGNTTYEEEIFNFGFPGPPQHFKMFTVLKRRPIEKYIKQIKTFYKKNECILLITGIRHDESSIRAGYKAAIKKEGSIIWVNPFYFNTKYDFELYRQEYGLPRNPVTNRLGYSGECLCGSYAKSGELEILQQIDQDAYNYIKQLENKVEQLGHERCKWGSQIRGASLPKPQEKENFMPLCVGCNSRVQ